jgi:hypothetical protein
VSIYQKPHHHKDFTMTKTLGYYGVDTANSLITDIISEWGENLSQMPVTDRVWLLYRMSDSAFLLFDQANSTDADAVRDRLHELDQTELSNLKQALALANGKPLGYWMLNYDSPLIADMAECWGEGLENLADHDRYWLIARIASHFWLTYLDSQPSEDAQAVFEREEELESADLESFIKALADF